MTTSMQCRCSLPSPFRQPPNHPTLSPYPHPAARAPPPNHALCTRILPSITTRHRPIAVRSVAGATRANPHNDSANRSVGRFSWPTAPTNGPIVVPTTVEPLWEPRPPRPYAHPTSAHAFLTSTTQTGRQPELSSAAQPMTAQCSSNLLHPPSPLAVGVIGTTLELAWVAIRQAAHSRWHRPCHPDPQLSRLRRHLPHSGRISRTASSTLATIIDPRPALPRTRSVCREDRVHTPSRRSCTAGPTAPEPSRAAVPPPTQLTHCEVPQRHQTSGGLAPHSHRTRGLVGGPTRGLLLMASSRAATHGGAALGAAAALPPPSSPSRAQRVPPRIWRESTPPDTLVKDSRPGDAASSSHACVPARA